MQTLVVLGSTGSIGCHTLDIVAQHPDAYSVFLLSAGANDERLLEQCRQFKPRYAFLENNEAAKRLRACLSKETLPTHVIESFSDYLALIQEPEVDSVVSGIVGAAGLLPTLTAVQAGKKVLLANKESLVTAGELFMSEVARHGASLIPLDSEHNAIFQCLPFDEQDSLQLKSVDNIILTASGGPFRTWTTSQMQSVTPVEACSHPNWSMGRKISVDSASMMNKGLELIEAHWLFGLSEKQIDIVVHPQSIVHSLIQYRDGSTLAQLGNHDMRVPINYGLSWPKRISSGVSQLDLLKAKQLDFEAADYERFPCLRLARDACKAGGNAAAVLNAANEVAVDAFLNEQIGFMQIPEINEAVLASTPQATLISIEDVLETDRKARVKALAYINQGKG